MAVSLVLFLAYNQPIKPSLVLLIGYSFSCSILLFSMETKRVTLVFWKRRDKHWHITAGIMRDLGNYH